MPDIELPTAAVVTPPPVVAEPAPSIADHAAQFGPQTDAPAADPPPEKKDRGQRASKQAATPEDVPRIKELTQKWRSEERRAQALEAEIAKLKAAPPAAVQTPAATATGEPKLDDFASADDPYAEYLLAKADWRADQRQAKANAERATQTESQTRETEWRALETKVAGQITEFAKTTPDYYDVVETLKDEEVPPLLLAALTAGDNFPELVYYLGTHPADRAELHLTTDGKSVTDQSVATVRRLLSSRLAAASTGAAPARSLTTAPRPPTPVRGGTLKTGDDLPGEVASIADHARVYGPKRRP